MTRSTPVSHRPPHVPSPGASPPTPQRRRAVLGAGLVGIPLYAVWFALDATWDERRRLGDWFWDAGLAPSPGTSVTLSWVVPALAAVVAGLALWLAARAVLAGRAWGRIALTVAEPLVLAGVLLVAPVWRHLVHGELVTVALVAMTSLAVATSLALLWGPSRA